MTKFSIIIPNYNSSKWLKKCLESILLQTYTDYEIIIVDDVSNDDSPELIKSYSGVFGSRIKFIQLKEKRFNGGSRNVGIDNATGEYILFLDCDDWLYNNKVLEEINNTINKTNADLIRLSYCAYKNGKKAKVRISETNLKSVANSVFCAPWTKCIKREKIVKFPENTLLEDVVQHIAQLDNIETMANDGNVYAVWNRDNSNAISSDVMKYDKNSKRYSSVYRNMADLLDLQCKHDYCEEQRQFRIRNYEDIIQKGDILGLINGVETR